MGRTFSGRVSAVTVPATNAFTIFQYTAPATRAVKIKELVWGVDGTADFGDAQAGGLNMRFSRGTSGTTSATGGGGAVTMEAYGEAGHGSPAGALTASHTPPMVAGGGSIDILRDEPFNLQVGYRFQPPEGQEIIIAPGERFEAQLSRNSANELTTATHGTIVVEEIG